MTIVTVSDSFSRPANTTQYGDGDLVANSATAGSVVPLKFHLGDGGGYIVNALFSKSDTGVTAADFQVHFFGASPTVSNGDNGAIAYNVSSYIDTIDFATMTAATDDAFANANVGDSILPSGIFCGYETVYALVESDSTYTPASAETFTLKLTVQK